MTCFDQSLTARRTKVAGPMTDVLATLASRWAVHILEAVATGHVRFNQLHRHLGAINHKVLIETLHRLQRDGYLTGPLTAEPDDTEVGGVIPYQLTDLGRRFRDLVVDIRDWSERHAPHLDQARAEFERLAVRR